MKLSQERPIKSGSELGTSLKDILKQKFEEFKKKSSETPQSKFIKENIAFAVAQVDKMLQAVEEPTTNNYPRTMNDDGEPTATNMYNWTSGFFPGSLWYLYELTSDIKWRDQAEKWTKTLEPLKNYTKTHDLGFMMFCSYGNAERLASKPEYKEILIETANSLSTRFSNKTHTIKSWNNFTTWDGLFNCSYPVIIDNMMNLELLFYGSKATGDQKYYNIAVSHADATLKNHFREDFGTYHVVSYDPITGAVANKATAQGFSDNSTWARGQTWAIYGFTTVYKATKDRKYLDAATKTADYYLKNLPEDLIPVWDFNVGQPGYVPGKNSHAAVFQEKLRDASAAAVACSAFFDLGKLSGRKSYTETAIKMLHSLASPAYRAALGSTADFLLKHSVGNIPSNFEIDKPLVYADYYFLEALVRYKKMISA